NADQIAERLEAVGAQLGLGAERDMAWLSIRSLTDERAFETAMETVSVILARPNFEPDDLERTRKSMQTAIRLGEQKPGTIASKLFYRELFGDHPYASPQDGTQTSLAAITRDQVVAFHQRYYVAQNATIAIVGQLDRARAEAIAARVADALPAGARAPALPAVGPAAAGLEHVEFPSIQSHVRVGLPGMSRNDPDYFPLLVGNHALGGNALVSILFQEIRAKRGLSYSAYSYFLPMAQPGPFVVALQTDRSQQDEALEVLNQTLAGFINDGPPPAALESAKKNLVGGFPLRIDSNEKIAEYISMIGFYDLPLDYLETFTDQVAAVTGASVQDAFRRRVALDGLVTVVVGRGDADAGS
ncbi:MAG: M16 family metallopeptidase, partial [Gammaproteobacteria bacterium]